MASVESMSVAQLKAAIKEGGLDFAGLTEKPELVARAREALERSAAGKAAKQDAGGSAAAKPAGDAAGAKPKTPAVGSKTNEQFQEQVKAMSVLDLKRTVARAGMLVDGISEKSELQAAAVEALVILSQKKTSEFVKPLGTTLVTKKNGLQPTSDALSGKDFVLLYFSAHWCPPCRQFTPAFATWYENHSKSKNFEVVFVSMDRDDASFASYYASMPWTAIPFTAPERQQAIANYKVNAVPELIVMDADCNIIRRGAVQNVMADPSAASFPWR